MADDVLLGAVIGAQGLRGEVRVKSFTADPANLKDYGPLRTRDGRTLEVRSARALKGDLLAVHFRGVDDRNAAEALKGAELLIARTALPPADAEEFYHADMIGLAAEDTEGRRIGDVSAIHNFGAGDVIEIARDDGDTVLLPFTRERVPTIDLAGRRIVIAEPEDPAALQERGIE